MPELQPNVDRIVSPSELDSMTYVDSAGDEYLYPRMTQGPAKPLTEDDEARDALGFTHPNLHRRTDPQDPPTADDPRNQELTPREYSLELSGVHSYRAVTITTHDEESIDSEIP